MKLSLNYLLVLWLVIATPAVASAVNISLDDFVRHSETMDAKISPKGDYVALSIHSGDEGGALIILDRDSGQITGTLKFNGRDQVGRFLWANDERVVLEVVRKANRFDAPYRTGELYAVNADGSKDKLIFGFGTQQRGLFNPKVNSAQIISVLPNDARHVLISESIYRRGKGSLVRAVKLNIYSGKSSTQVRAPAEDAVLLADTKGRVRIAWEENANEDGSNNFVLYHRSDDDNEWSQLGHYNIFTEGALRPVGFSSDDKTLYVLANDKTDKTVVDSINLETGERKTIFQHANVDVDFPFIDEDGALFAVKYEHDRPLFEIVDPQHKYSAHITALQQHFSGQEVSITSNSRAGDFVIAVFGDVNPGKFYIYAAKNKSLTEISQSKPWLDPVKLAPMHYLEYKARDGLTIPGYLSMPLEHSDRYPTVILVHGGPHYIRDRWGYREEVQVLVNNGYAVFQPNFRGSGGYGSTFLSKGFRQWGRAMQDDVEDAVQFLIDGEVTDPDRVCIMGASYGGYSALSSVTRENHPFKCAVSMVGVYDLEMMYKEGDLLESQAGENYLKTFIGEDIAELRKYSPIHNLENLNVPVFIAHGGKDRRVPLIQAENLRKKLDELDKPYEWLVKEKEGHGFYKAANRKQYYEQVLAFLQRQIGPE